MTPADLTFLRNLAHQATATEGDPTTKWQANAQIMAWFRSDPVAVIDALQAAAHVVERPGGLINQRLRMAIRALHPVRNAA